MVWSQWMYIINKKWLGTWETHQYICMHVQFGRWALVMSFDRCVLVWMCWVSIFACHLAFEVPFMRSSIGASAEDVWLWGGSSPGEHLSGTSVFTTAVPHRRPDITSFLTIGKTILVFCMFHISLLLSLFFKFQNYSKKIHLKTNLLKRRLIFCNFHFKWGWVVCALWASATQLWWGEIMICIACLKMAKSIF